MKNNHTFSTLAMVRRSKANKLGEVPVIIRLTVNGKIKEITTKHFVNPELWDSTKGKVKGKSELAHAINKTIDSFKLKAVQQYSKLIEEGKDINPEIIKNRKLGIEKQQPTLLDFFTKIVDGVKARVGTELTQSCYYDYSATLKHLLIFVKDQYIGGDIRLKDLNYKFIADFELYLKTKGKCRQNGALKHIYRLKYAAKLAIKYEYIPKNPFLQHSMQKEKVVVQPLNEDELNRIASKTFFSERLSIIRDMFLFTCYTGLSFIDAKTLRKEHIGIGVDDEEWVFIERRKTGNPCSIPLFGVN